MSSEHVRGLRCDTCGVEWQEPVRNGPRPRFCINCKDPKNRARDLRRIVERLPGTADLIRTGGPSDDGDAAVAPLRMAAALGLTKGNVKRAAALAGVPDEQAQALAAEAREHYGDLIEGKGQAVQELLHAAILFSAISVIAKSSGLSASSAASAIKSLTASMESIQQGGRKVFSQVVLNIPGLSEAA